MSRATGSSFVVSTYLTNEFLRSTAVASCLPARDTIGTSTAIPRGIAFGPVPLGFDTLILGSNLHAIDLFAVFAPTAAHPLPSTTSARHRLWSMSESTRYATLSSYDAALARIVEAANMIR